jgi:aminopeptidase N
LIFTLFYMKYFFLFLSFSLFGQQTTKVDFISLNASVFPNVTEKSISGKVTYKFKVFSAIDTIKIDAKNMSFSDVKINETLVQYKNTGKELQLFQGFKTGNNILTFNYKVTPKQTLYFIGEGENLQIWTQGQGKYTSHWLPSFDDVNEKVIFSMDITFDKSFQVISNGILKKGSATVFADGKNGQKTNSNAVTWKYEMKKPMSSYLVMIAIGKYEKQVVTSKSGTPIELYLKPADNDKFEPTYRYSARMFDFLEKEIGVKYPWEVYRQVPINDFLYAGMENTSATLFSQEFVVDSIGFNDKNYINVNAHELAHQWFGDLITAKSGEDHWLQEGFATYYSLLAEKEIFGEDHFNFEMLKFSGQLISSLQTDVTPILDKKASVQTFYKKGAWSLFVLSEGVGHQNFQKAVKNYLEKYKYKNVTTDNFLAEVKKVSSYDVAAFKDKWLAKVGFDTLVSTKLLNRNNSIKQFFDIAMLSKVPFLEKKKLFEDLLKSAIPVATKQEIIFQLMEVPLEDKKELLVLAFQSDDIAVLQVLAQFLFFKIPIELKSEYESLLQKKSYVLQEIALVNLCKHFPSDKEKYLSYSKDWIGFNNKNLRITWLSIALTTPEFEPSNQSQYEAEFFDYCTANYDSVVRQEALEKALPLFPANKKVLLSLVNGTTHHRWQFVGFCKESIRKLIKEEKYRKLFQDLLLELSEKEKINLEKLLAE